MIIRDFSKPFELADWTQELLLVPNVFGKITQMGLFENESVSQNTITFEKSLSSIGLLTDTVRGTRNAVSKDYLRELRAYPVPHFTLDDAISPSDIQGKAAYGKAGDGAPEQLDLVRLRKMERIRKSHAQTLEVARAKMIVTGDVYAPNGTVAVNMYTDFGITRKDVDFVLGTGTTEILLKEEEVIAHIQDNLQSGDVVNEIVVLCSPEYFNKLITHATIKEAYKFYSSTQEPLRARLGSGLDREFVHGPFRYMEYRTATIVGGSPLIPAGEARAFPVGVSDMFKTYFGPAHRFEFVNTLGLEAYLFEETNASNTEILLKSETNFLNLNRRPQCVCRLFSSN